MKLLPVGNGVLWHQKLGPAWRTAFAQDQLSEAVTSLLDPVDRAGGAIEAEMQARIDGRIAEAGLPLIIACPPQFHLHYLQLAARLGLPAVLEKPLVHDQRSLACLEDAALTGRVFCLGYYALEKGLSLKHVLQPHPAHLPLLVASDAAGQAVEAEAVAEPMHRALRKGRIKRITLRMLEDDGRSVALDHAGLHWTEQWESGANWLDMGVHMASLLTLILPDALPEPNQFAIRTACYPARLAGLSEHERKVTAPHLFQLCSKPDAGTAIDIAFGKYCVRDRADAQRHARIELEDGSILHCDFDLQATEWRGPDGRLQGKISLAPVINGIPQARYLAQLSLARPMLEAGGWAGPRTDSLAEQQAGLDLLMGLQPAAQVARPVELGELLKQLHG